MDFAIFNYVAFKGGTGKWPQNGYGFTYFARTGTMSSVRTEPIDKSSLEIKRRITNLLSQRGVSSLRRLNIEVANGTATLRGTVASFYERQLCLSCCQHVPGVFKLVDEIEVD